MTRQQTFSPDIILDPLFASLGSHLKTTYLYGSYAQGFYQPGESDINMLVVTDETADFHTARQAVQTVWTQDGLAAAFQHPPTLVRQSAFTRHLNLNPALAHHLVAQGQHLAGTPLSAPHSAPDPADLLAQDINQTILASSVLANHLLEPEIAQERWRLLRHLTRRLSGRPVPPKATAVQLLGWIQNHLQKRLNALSLPLPSSTAPDESAPPLLPDLQAIYEVTEEVLLILPDLSSARLAQTDWHAVADLLAGDYNGIRLTTPAQFHLALQHANPLGIRLMRYTLAWGVDGLANVPISTAAICREAARNTSHILTTLLPQMYLAADDDHVSKVVHDVQNKLLNVQLQHELLHRLLGWERVLPPFPLPDRHTPAQERVDANFAHFEWWSAYYSEQLAANKGS